MNPSSWPTDAGTVALARVVEQLGLSMSRRSISPCPLCASATACKVFRSKDAKDRWHCHSCQKGGDVIDLVACVLTGSPLPRGHSPASETVRAWFASRGWCLPAEDSPAKPPPKPLPREAPAGREAGAPSAPPPAPEVRDLLRACRPVLSDPVVAGWLRERLGPRASLDALVGRGVIGALPSDAPLPRWARFRRRSWAELGYRAILPVYDASGAPTSVRARCVVPPPEGAPKALPPTGFSVRGLVMADALGQYVLREGRVPPGWRGATFRVVVTEGEPAFLAWAAEMQGRAAVLGIVAGSWSPEIAARLPDGARVAVATDFDAPGERYAARILETLSDRCTAYRWEPSRAA